MSSQDRIDQHPDTGTINRRSLLRGIGMGGVFLGAGTGAFAWNMLTDPENAQASAIGGSIQSGGGYTNSGLKGEYFANQTLSGNPTFTRNDVRIDFNWGNSSPSGSISAPHTSVNADNFSVRWTGQVIPRYSETYTFITTSDDGVRLFIKRAGTSTWTTLINNWSAHAPVDNSGTYAMTAGQTYDIKLEYFEATGGALIRLAWESPSTPRQAIEPVCLTQANMDTIGDSDPALTLANVFAAHRGPFPLVNGETVPVDSNGWPTSDFQYIWWDGGFTYYTNISGTYRLSFNGQADLALALVQGRIENKTYNAGTNTTTADIVITQTANTSPYLKFTNTKRTASSATKTGITTVKLMRPIAPGSNTSYPPTTLFTTEFLEMASSFTILRQMGNTASITADPQKKEWANRRRVTFASLVGKDFSSNATSGMPWEIAIQFWNQTGRDAYVNVPFAASDDYVQKLAQALRYGTDGVNPYTSIQANPVYPPLNSNLKIYVEYSNELWNYFSDFPAQENEDAAEAEIVTNPNSPLNYDGQYDPATTNGKYQIAHRRAIKRGKEISEIFRSVFEDSAMMTRVRPVFMWQYSDANETASNALEFLDDYYNNGDGIQHVSNPHPVNYFFWGGGGATYYTTGNRDATTVDGMYNAGIPQSGYRDQLRAQNVWARLYGLEYVVYEGGWSVETDCGNGGYGCVNDVTKAAKFDPRAKQAHITADQIFREEGGAINSVLIPIGNERAPWSMTYSIYDLDAPLWQGHRQLINALPAEVNAGPLVNTSGTVTFSEFDSDHPDFNVGGSRGKPKGAAFSDNQEFKGSVFRVAANGTYTVKMSIKNAGAQGKIRCYVDGTLLAMVTVPQGNSAQTVTIGSVSLRKGQHAFMLQPYANASNGADNAGVLSNVTITRSGS